LLFEGAPDKPNRKGLALMTYIQWLGSWHETYPYYETYEKSPLLELDLNKPAEAGDAAE
jgi:cytochrome c oxidase cbb3-type subunit II